MAYLCLTRELVLRSAHEPKIDSTFDCHHTSPRRGPEMSIASAFPQSDHKSPYTLLASSAYVPPSLRLISHHRGIGKDRQFFKINVVEQDATVYMPISTSF